MQHGTTKSVTSNFGTDEIKQKIHSLHFFKHRPTCKFLWHVSVSFAPCFRENVPSELQRYQSNYRDAICCFVPTLSKGSLRLLAKHKYKCTPQS
jgi:hypothetical protein